MPEELNIRMRVLADLGGAEQVARVVGKTADSADKLGKSFDKVDAAAGKATKSIEGLTKANGGGSGETPIAAMADDAGRLAANLEQVEASAKQAATAVQRTQQQAASQRPVSRQDVLDFARDPNAVDPTHLGPYKKISEREVLDRKRNPYVPAEDSVSSKAEVLKASAASKELPEHLTKSLRTPEIQKQMDSLRAAAKKNAAEQLSAAKQIQTGLVTMSVSGVAAILALRGAWRGYLNLNPEVIGSLKKLRSAFEENLGRRLEQALDWLVGGDFAKKLDEMSEAVGASSKAMTALGQSSAAFRASDLTSELEKQEKAFDKHTAAIQRNKQALDSEIDRNQQQADDFTAEQLDAIEQDQTLPESEKILRRREVQRKAEEDTKDRTSYKRHADLQASEQQLEQVEKKAKDAAIAEKAVKEYLETGKAIEAKQAAIDASKADQKGKGWFTGGNTRASVKAEEEKRKKLAEEVEELDRYRKSLLTAMPEGMRNDLITDPKKEQPEAAKARQQEMVKRLEEERKRTAQQAEMLRPDVEQKRYDVAMQDAQDFDSFTSRNDMEDARAKRESDTAKAQESAKVIDAAKGKADEAQAEVDKQARSLQEKLEQLAQQAAQKNEATGAFVDALAKGLEDGLQKGELEKIRAAMANFTTSANKAFADLAAGVVANTKSIEQTSALAADAKKTAEAVRIYNSQTL